MLAVCLIYAFSFFVFYPRVVTNDDESMYRRQTALMLAARGGHVEAVRALVYAGAFLDHTAKHDLSALMLAAIGGHEEVVEVLLRAGADTGLKGTGAPGFAGKTALDIAEDLGREEVAAQLREVSG